MFVEIPLLEQTNRSSKGVNSEKHLHNSPSVQDMTKTLHDAENCNFGAHGFNVKSVSPKVTKRPITNKSCTKAVQILAMFLKW